MSTHANQQGFTLPSQTQETLPELDKVTYTYTLKIINPKRKSQFRVEKFRREGLFKTPLELQTFIVESYKEYVPSVSVDFDVGYFKPSRGSS